MSDSSAPDEKRPLMSSGPSMYRHPAPKAANGPLLLHKRGRALSTGETVSGLHCDGLGEKAPLGTVQALLGHSSPEVTRQICLHAIPAEQRRAVEEMEKLLVGPKWTQIEEGTQRPNYHSESWAAPTASPRASS